MKRLAFFSIPAHGHTNPMLPVAAALAARGHAVRFYSFEPFREKIEATGAVYRPCDAFLPPLTRRAEAGLKEVSTTEMSVQGIRTTLAMEDYLEDEYRDFPPDVVYADSVCFWGKLYARRHTIPLVVSTSTFAFNRLSAGYMRYSGRELAAMVLGMPRLARERRALNARGYRVKRILDLVQSDNETDTVVYTSRRFQPFGESFSGRYAFVGPSVFSKTLPDKDKPRPLVYISLGTVLYQRPGFYRDCVEALGDLPVDVLLSCGTAEERDRLGPLPANIRAEARVDQVEVLARADVFLTHCGMNSVSESLYMATPMVLYPQTGEERAVARRTAELGAGLLLTDDSPAGIRQKVLEVLGSEACREAARGCGADFRACAGPEGAADFLVTAPHAGEGPDLMAELDRVRTRVRLAWWTGVAGAAVLTGRMAGWKRAWIAGAAGGLLSGAADRAAQKRLYAALRKKQKKEP